MYYVPTGDPDGPQGGVNGGTSIIPPMQGYFVKVRGSDNGSYFGSLAITESARTTDTQAFWKSKQTKNEIDIIRIHVSGNNLTDETAIRFIPEATSGFDSDYDAFKLFPGEWYGTPQIYSVLSEEIIASINSLSGYYDELIIPIGFQTPVSDAYSIYIPEFDLDKSTEIYFEDTYDEKIYDLTIGLIYNFFSDYNTFDE